MIAVSRKFLTALPVAAMATAFVTLPALAQVQDSDQRKCSKAINKGGHGVARAQSRENINCVKQAGKGQLAITFDECLTADLKGKVAKAEGKTVAADTKSCGILPSFGYAGPSEANRAMAYEETRIPYEILDGHLFDPSDGADPVRCQAAVVKAYEKSATAMVKEFNTCTRKTLASGANSVAAIEACVGSDQKGKIANSEAKVIDAMAKKCAGVLLSGPNSGAFSGACDGADDGPTCAAKITTIVRCRSCEAIARMDGLTGVNCDLIDNGLADSSCSSCGNGILETGSGEECDDGAQVDGDCCDAECAFESPSGSEGPFGDATCSDGIDNDCDGYTDAAAFTCGDPDCPASVELLSLAGASVQACANNTDCSAHSGVCDPGLGRCVSESRIDFGYTGLGYQGDTLDLLPTRLKIACPGPGPTCGTCNVAGIDTSSGLCRCANDNRTVCDEPLSEDADDCGGAECVCYSAPPSPQLAGNTPTCWWHAVDAPVAGTIDVDAGALDITVRERTRMYLGINLVTPCPYCSGDITANDGVRDGTCVAGDNDGQSCDVNAWSASFPTSELGPIGAGASLDCAPDPGKNQSGAGIRTTLPLSTSSQSLSANLDCGFEGFAEYTCPCSICDNSSAQGCSSNSDCSAGGICLDFPGVGLPLPNDCTDQLCTDLGGGDGECTTGPDDQSCDGILRADGTPIISCLSNSDCAPGAIGIDAGSCAITQRRKCFPDPVLASGSADPQRPVAAALFCDAQDVGSGIGVTLGMPGPTRVGRESVLTSRCANMTTIYTPGVGGCP